MFSAKMGTEVNKKLNGTVVFGIKKAAVCLVRFLIAVLAGVVLTVSSGCTGISLDIEELMKPPALTERQKAIQKALEKAIGSNDYQLKRPKFGEERSAFIFTDINSDGIEEVLLFYSMDENEEAQLNILQNNGSEWLSTYNISGAANDVASINFAKLLNSNEIDIIIGWYNTNLNVKALEVYRYIDSSLEKIFVMEYDEMSIVDVTGDEIEDILLLTDDGKVALISRLNGQLLKFGEIKLKNEVDEYLKLTVGKLGDDKKALFIDYRLPSGEISSEAVYYYEQKLLTLFGTIGEEPPKREEGHCEDINGDGITEIPYQKLLPGYSFGDEVRMYITDYKQAKESGLVSAMAVLRDKEERFIFKLPEKWENNITVIVESENSEWSLREYEDKRAGEELLRIKVMRKGAYKDVFEENYQLIGEGNGYEYYIFVPENTSNIAVSFEECKNNFEILK